MLLNDDNYMICLKVLLILASQSTRVKHQFPQPHSEASLPCLQAMYADMDVTAIAASERICQEHRRKCTVIHLNSPDLILICGNNCNTSHPYGVLYSLSSHLTIIKKSIEE